MKLSKVLCLFLAAAVLGPQPSLARQRPLGPPKGADVDRIVRSDRESPNIAPTHQGWCGDGRFYYTVHTRRIDKRRRDADWSIVSQNTKPFAGLPNGRELNHLGDCDIDPVTGLLYLPVEKLARGTGNPPMYEQIAVYRTSDLSFVRSIDISGIGAHGAGGVAVDPAADTLWLIAGGSRTSIFRLRLSSGAALPPVNIPAGFRQFQGVAVGPDGLLYLAGESGRGRSRKVVGVFERNGAVRKVLQLPIDHTIEGLGFDSNGQLGVLDNLSGKNDPSIVRFFTLPGR